jgi:GPH family glycoside/pentoside/hexuronide:cation symporter
MPVVGSGVGAGILVPWAMLPEVVELDEVISHQKRGGLYYSVFGVLQQLGVAGALSVSSWVLGKCGYVSPKDQTGDNPQPQDVLTFFRVILGPAAILMLLLSALCCFFYPITKEMKEANSKILRDRREAALKAKKDAQATSGRAKLDMDDGK